MNQIQAALEAGEPMAMHMASYKAWANRPRANVDHLIAQAVAAIKANGPTAIRAKAPTGEKYEVPVHLLPDAAPIDPGRAATLKRILDTITSLAAILKSRPAGTVTPKPKPVDPVAMERAKLRAIRDAVGGNADFAADCYKARLTPAQANAALGNPERIWMHNLNGCQQAFRGNEKYFAAAYRADRASKAEADRRELVRSAK